MSRILALSIICFSLLGCDDEGEGLIERDTDSSSSSSDDSGSGSDTSGLGTGGTSTSNGVFSITPYRNATVSTDSIEGTWVSIGSGKDTFVEGGRTRNRNKNQLKVFVIKGYEGSYIASTCESESSSGSIAIESNSIEISGFGRGTLTNNRYAETHFEINLENEDYKETKSYNFKLAKISDSFGSIGNLSVNSGSGTDSRELDCFRRDEFLSLKVTEIQASGAASFSIEHSHALDDSPADIFMGVFGFGGDDYSNNAQYEFSEPDVWLMLMTFSGESESGQQVAGKIELNIK